MTDSFKRDKEICEQATEGPWWVEKPKDQDAYIAYGTRGDLSDTFDLYERYEIENDYEFIAAARTRWPAALEEIERLTSRIDELEAELSDVRAREKAWKKAAEGWMNNYDELNAKYEPMVLVASGEKEKK